jgi:predicted nuclease with TOPRIM domain
MPEEEEFELIPMSPLRRLEKRLEKIEGTKDFDAPKFFSELVEIVRMNQELVDELAKANDALRIELSRLPGKIEELVNSVNELVSFVKAAGTGGDAVSTVVAEPVLEPLLKKMDELVEGNKKIVESNESMMSTMEQFSTKLRRPAPILSSGIRRFPFKRSMPV